MAKKYRYFSGMCETLDYVESELIATLEDDMAELSHNAEGNAETIDELERKVLDIRRAFKDLTDRLDK